MHNNQLNQTHAAALLLWQRFANVPQNNHHIVVWLAKRYVYKEEIMKYLPILLVMLPMAAIAETVNYSCNYTSYSDNEGNHKVKNKLELNFIIDRATGKNYLLGNAGSSEVKAFESKDRVSFLEVTATGNIMTTAIDSKFNSVHSRNTVMYGELQPSQYYGKCVVK